MSFCYNSPCYLRSTQSRLNGGESHETFFLIISRRNVAEIADTAVRTLGFPQSKLVLFWVRSTHPPHAWARQLFVSCTHDDSRLAPNHVDRSIEQHCLPSKSLAFLAFFLFLTNRCQLWMLRGNLTEFLHLSLQNQSAVRPWKNYVVSPQAMFGGYRRCVAQSSPAIHNLEPQSGEISSFCFKWPTPWRSVHRSFKFSVAILFQWVDALQNNCSSLTDFFSRSWDWHG